jgi:hypothetical protein
MSGSGRDRRIRHVACQFCQVSRCATFPTCQILHARSTIDTGPAGATSIADLFSPSRPTAAVAIRQKRPPEMENADFRSRLQVAMNCSARLERRRDIFSETLVEVTKAQRLR